MITRLWSRAILAAAICIVVAGCSYGPDPVVVDPEKKDLKLEDESGKDNRFDHQ